MIPLITLSPITSTWYVATRYRKDKDGMIIMTKKYDVTDQMQEILKQHGKSKLKRKR